MAAKRTRERKKRAGQVKYHLRGACTMADPSLLDSSAFELMYMYIESVTAWHFVWRGNFAGCRLAAFLSLFSYTIRKGDSTETRKTRYAPCVSLSDSSCQLSTPRSLAFALGPAQNIYMYPKHTYSPPITAIHPTKKSQSDGPAMIVPLGKTVPTVPSNMLL
jgi:hypothetical protein